MVENESALRHTMAPFWHAAGGMKRKTYPRIANRRSQLKIAVQIAAGSCRVQRLTRFDLFILPD